MRDALGLLQAVWAGMALGALFFGGLWWTVRRGLTTAWPATLFLGSVLVRVSALLAGLWWVSGGAWSRLFAAALGVAMARWVASRWASRGAAPCA